MPSRMSSLKRAREAGYLAARLEDIAPVACPCGQSRRAFAVPGNKAASIHLVEISKDARAHHHETLTEIYYVLEGSGHLELDEDRVALSPGVAVLIRPGTRHRAVGKLRVLVISTPPFDPADEHLEGEGPQAAASISTPSKASRGGAGPAGGRTRRGGSRREGARSPAAVPRGSRGR